MRMSKRCTSQPARNCAGAYTQKNEDSSTPICAAESDEFALHERRGRREIGAIDVVEHHRQPEHRDQAARQWRAVAHELSCCWRYDNLNRCRNTPPDVFLELDADGLEQIQWKASG